MSSLRYLSTHALPFSGGIACGIAQALSIATTSVMNGMNTGLMGSTPGSRDPGGGGTS